MVRRIRNLFSRRTATVDHYDAGVITTADDVPAARLIEELELQVDSRPSHEYPGWRRPVRVLVMGASPARMTWLRAVAGDVPLVVATTAAEGERLVAEADVLIGWFTPTMIERGTSLRWLQLQRAGAESVASEPLIASRGIVVTNLKRVASPVVADHAMAMLLALTRRLPELAAYQRARRWAQPDVDASGLRTLHGRTMLVAGLGGIGTAVARRAHASGMRLMAVRAGTTAPPPFVKRVGRPDQLLALAGEADILVNALPLTEATHGMFDHAVFGVMPAGSVFVNVGRGASVVTADLISALRHGPLAGAALDVTDPQPLPAGDPLWTMPNVIVTPHVASWSATTAAWGWIVARENLRRYVAGEPLVSVVDLTRGY